MVAAPGGPASSPSTTGWPLDSTTRPPGSRAATQSAAARIGGPPSRLTLVIARNSDSSRICSEEGTATVDRDHLAGQPRGSAQEHDAVGDVLRPAEPPERDPLQERALPLLSVGVPLRDRRRDREDEPRRDRVDRNAERAELVRRLAREPELAVLGAGVGLDAGQGHAAPRARGDVHDPPPARRLHAWGDRARANEGAGQI